MYFFVGSTKEAKDIIWGVNFSQKHSQNLGLDWKKNYLALLDDLKIKNLKITVHWDLIEPQEDKYNFEDLDWQINTAKERGARIILVIGIKTGRWPECHIPQWAESLKKGEQQKRVLRILEKIVSRYREEPTIKYWQVENEPFFPFGQCPWVDRDFLKKEVDLVKFLDNASSSDGAEVDFQKRSIIISDSGEWSFWIKAARLGDIVGNTIYKKAWFDKLGRYINYKFPPIFYWRKAKLIKKFFGKEVICVELQAEPWGPTLLYDSSLEEQRKTMNLEQFRKNIDFARKTGLKEFYLWGGEWWFWLKEKYNQSEIWHEARRLFGKGEL